MVELNLCSNILIQAIMLACYSISFGKCKLQVSQSIENNDSMIVLVLTCLQDDLINNLRKKNLTVVVLLIKYQDLLFKNNFIF
jgi:hypothetical protein